MERAGADVFDPPADGKLKEEQLRVANIQQGEGSESLAHNYALYLKYQDQL